jgi:predicted protein tyrosine phosphatase
VRRVLFLCGRNRLRSPTAEHVFSARLGIEVTSAGLDNDADVACTPELLEWADIVFVMEKAHRSKLTSRFKRYLNNARVICLDIPDNYEFMQPELVRLLHARVDRHLRRGVERPHGA